VVAARQGQLAGRIFPSKEMSWQSCLADRHSSSLARSLAPPYPCLPALSCISVFLPFAPYSVPFLHSYPARYLPIHPNSPTPEAQTGGGGD